MLYVFNRGGDEDTYIAVKDEMHTLSCLNLDTSSKILVKLTMLHNSDRSKDFSREIKRDCNRQEVTANFNTKFYKIADLQKNGFIHPHDRLRFEFSIKGRNNSQKRVITAEKRAITAEKRAISAEKKNQELMSLVEALRPTLPRVMSPRKTRN